MRIKKNVKKIALTLNFFIISCHAFAQGSSEWVRPASDMIENLESGLVTIGVPIIGIAIVGTGLMMATAERPNWARVGTIFIAGCLVTAGPTILKMFLGN